MSAEYKGFLLVTVVKMLVIFTAYMVGVMMVIWAERRVSAWKQYRLGPNRVGPAGLLQSVADGVKNILKEETWPADANKPLFLLAPVMSFIPAMLTWAVIPFAAPMPVHFDFTVPWLGRFIHDGPTAMMVANLPVGFLFVLAIGSLGVYGIVLAGWASNSKYAFLGAMRAGAQMVSYEVALGFSIVTILILAGNVTLTDIVVAQQHSTWFVWSLTLGFVLFFVSALAETNRLPFDLPETESELVTGYHTEYSSMKFSMFFIAEYTHVITGSALIATLFFGGYDIPFYADPAEPTVGYSLLSLVVFGVKILFFIYTYIWIRWTLPRFRFDQLMALGWKLMLPVSLSYVIIISVSTYFLGQIDRTAGLILFGINAVVLFVVFGLMDRGRVLQGAAHREVKV